MTNNTPEPCVVKEAYRRREAERHACTGIPTEALEAGVIQELIGTVKDSILTLRMIQPDSITAARLEHALAKLEGK